ncbi:MAG: N-acetyltransferase, (GNAT) family [Amphiamblys sp. WSBS2006]|nr:MAG: N-acetyltransferase, (GNAT) family [Amphiamblys sp. WSBS2006]
MSLQRLSLEDLLELDNVNLDRYTENFEISFYLFFMEEFPDLCLLYKDHRHAGYLLARLKVECGVLMGHLAFLSVGSNFRGTGIAQRLMEGYENTVVNGYNAKLAALYVRPSNKHAINFYANIGYTVYRTMPEYYTGSSPEDGYEMRKDLAR